MAIVAANAETVIADIEERLTGSGAGLSLNLANRIELHSAMAKTLAHQLVSVHISTTVNDQRSRRQLGRTRVTDTIEVQMTYRVQPHDQRTSRNEALALARGIRERLTGHESSWLYEIMHTRTERGPHPNTVEYYLIRQQFSLQRHASLGEG